MWSDECSSVKGSAGGTVKWFAPSICPRLSVRARTQCPSKVQLKRLTRLLCQPCDGTLETSSKEGGRLQ